MVVEFTMDWFPLRGSAKVGLFKNFQCQSHTMETLDKGVTDIP